MPRAYDPSLVGQQIPVDHDPLARIEYRTAKPDFNLDALMGQITKFIEDYLFPVIENLTGIDLSAFLPLLDLLDLDFSSPAAFFMSLITAVLALPQIVLQLLTTFIDELMNLPETFAALISNFIQLLVSLPSMLVDLLTGLVEQLASITGIDLSVFLPLLDLLNIDLSSPSAFLGSLMSAVMAIPSVLADVVAGIIGWISDMTGVDLSVFLPLLDLLNFDFASPAAFISSFTTAIMSFPTVLADLVNGIVDTIINLPDTLTSLLDNLVQQLGVVPEILNSLLHEVITALADLTGIDLSIFLPLLDLLNFDFSSPEAFIASITTNIMALPEVFMDFVNGFITLLSSDPTAMGDMLGGLIDTLTGLPAMLGDLLTALVELLASSPEIFSALIQAAVTLLASTPDIILSLANSLLATGAGLLGANSPLNALNIFGTLGSGLFGAVPIGSLVNKIVNIVPLGGLFKPGSIAPGGGWFTDLLDLGGGPGSAKVTADGTKHGLLGVTIPVAPGQKLDLSAKAKWSGLTSSGASPITFGLKSLFGDTPVGNTTIGSVTSPGAAGTQTLSGQYTVPASGVDSIRLRLGVNGNATAGTVWFSSITGGQPGQIEQDWVSNLIPQFDGILSIFGLNHLSDLIGLIPSAVDDLWTQAIEVIINPLGVLSDVVARLTSQGTIDAAIEAVEGLPIVGGTIAEFFDAIDEIFGTALSGQSMATDAQGDVDDLTHNLLTAPAGVMGALPQSSVTNLPGDLGNRLTLSGGTGWTDWSQRMYQAFSGGQFSGVMPSNSQMFNTFIDFYSVLSQSGANYANLNRNQTENTQTKQIMAGQVVTPINSLIASIKAWFDAHF